MHWSCFGPDRGRATPFACVSILTLVALAAPTRLRSAQSALEPHTPLTRTLAPGEHHRYTIALDAGASARVVLATELSLVATLDRPDHSPLVLIDDASEETAPQSVDRCRDSPAFEQQHRVRDQSGALYQRGLPYVLR